MKLNKSYTINLDENTEKKVLQKANKHRRKPRELLRLIVLDNLEKY